MIVDFDAWWRQAYFRTDHPYYGIYKKLHKAGADLEYIDGLTRILRVSDEECQNLTAELKDTEGKRDSTHPMAIRKWVKRRIQEYTRKNRIRLTGAKRSELEKEMEALVAKQTKPHTEKIKTSLLQNANRISRTNPIQSLVFEYGGAPSYYATGRRPDDIGSFFLLAISEHMRKRRKKPQFLLAANLLRTVRRQQSNWTKSSRMQAMVRVAKFKKSAQNWKKHLRMCQESYRDFTAGRNSSPIATEQTLAALTQGGDIKPTFKR
jgi:uncharacterized ParB-like nuclease family protein